MVAPIGSHVKENEKKAVKISIFKISKIPNVPASIIIKCGQTVFFKKEYKTFPFAD